MPSDQSDEPRQRQPWLLLVGVVLLITTISGAALWWMLQTVWIVP